MKCWIENNQFQITCLHFETRINLFLLAIINNELLYIGADVKLMSFLLSILYASIRLNNDVRVDCRHV